MYQPHDYTGAFPTEMRDVLQQGDETAIGKALAISQQSVHEMKIGARRCHFEACEIIIKMLRARGNPKAERLIERLNRRLGYQAYRLEGQQIDDADFAELLREFSDVVDERAKAEADHVITSDEDRAIAARVDALISGALKYRDALLARADDDEPQPARRTA